MSKDTVALALTIAGVVEIPARIVNGFLADRKIMSAVTHLSLCMCLTGTAALLCATISGLEGRFLEGWGILLVLVLQPDYDNR